MSSGSSNTWFSTGERRGEGVVPCPAVLLTERRTGCGGNAKEAPVTLSRASRVKFRPFYFAHHDPVSHPPRPSPSPAGTQSLFTQRPRLPALRRLRLGLGARRGVDYGPKDLGLRNASSFPPSPCLGSRPGSLRTFSLRSAPIPALIGTFSKPDLSPQGTGSCPDSS